jgi:tRNA A-37 threonylcarbamoyl transferase component Bud32
LISKAFRFPVALKIPFLCVSKARVNIPSREQSTTSRGSRARSSGGRGCENNNANKDADPYYPLRATASQLTERVSNSTTQSFSSKFAKWTRKVQQGIACGASLPSTNSLDEQDIDIEASAPKTGVIAGIAGYHSMERPMPEKPPRTKQAPGQYHGKRVGGNNSDLDYDGHTLATATTASATISYSTDQGDDVSEAGMEVIMGKNDSADHEIDGRMMVTRSDKAYVSHSFTAGKNTFTVDTRYEMIRVIGSGAYGVVISAKDEKTQENVAIKMVPKAFSDEIDAKRILREIKLLNHFHHDNIVRMVDMMPPNVKYLEDFTDVYLVVDLMETDLHRIIYSKQKLSMDHAQYFIYQLLRGLKYIHSCRVLHRDLKPSNLLVNSNCDLKICDFGLARGIRSPESAGQGTMLLTEYVVTRWYRAPEIMLACHEYSYPVDVWSVGCIFAELILRKPYFPGDDYIDQV